MGARPDRGASQLSDPILLFLSFLLILFLSLWVFKKLDLAVQHTESFLLTLCHLKYMVSCYPKPGPFLDRSHSGARVVLLKHVICACVCMCVFVCVHMCAHVCAHICTCVRTHEGTHLLYV